MSDEKDKGTAPDKSDDKDKGQDKTPDNTGHMIPKARLDQEIAKRKGAESALSDVADTLVETVPEDKRDLIPDLPPADKIKWLQKANAAGLFLDQTKPNGPDPKQPGGKPPTDFENMTHAQMRASGYNT